MTILVDIRHLAEPKSSGVGEYTTQLLNALFRIDRTNKYILFSTGHHEPKISNLFAEHLTGDVENNRASYIHVPTPNKLLNVRTLLTRHPTFSRYVKDRIDLIWMPNLNITELPTDIPMVLTMHDLSWKHFPHFYSHHMRLWHKAVNPDELVARATKIVVPSHATRKDVCSVLKAREDKVSVIPHGVDSMFTPHMEARDHGVRSKLRLPKRFALFMGTIEPRKNLIALIEALVEYRRVSRDDLHLVLSGKWGWKSHDLRRRLWQRDTKDWVHELGYVDARDRPALYRSAHVFTWPSIYEGFGLPVLEAMACGTPVITSVTSSLPEVTNGAAVLVDPFNSRDIADALVGLVGSKPMQDRLSQQGLERAQTFSWEKTAIQTKNLFESINTSTRE